MIQGIDHHDAGVVTTVLQFPDRILPGTGESCAQTQTTVAEFSASAYYDYYYPTTTDNCDSIRALVLFPNRFWDIASYCGCPDAVAPRVCSVCNDVTTAADRPLPPAAASALQLSFSISYSEDDDSETPPSCGDLIALAPYVVDASICEDLQVLQSFCCDSSNDKDDDHCSLCPTGEAPQSPYKMMASSTTTISTLPATAIVLVP